MGVVYSRERGVERIDYSCGAKIGDFVTAYRQSYQVVEIDDWGCYVCRNLNPRCLAHDDVRTFDDLDIDSVITADDPRFTAYGDGI